MISLRSQRITLSPRMKSLTYPNLMSCFTSSIWRLSFKMRSAFSTPFVAIIALLLSAIPLSAQIATGIVFEDRNSNGVRDPGETGLHGVRVSNQREVVLTDATGRWHLPLMDDGETTFFVIKPRGYRTPLSDHQLPRFSYTHKPEGTPALKYKGFEPTGPLPESIDFALEPSDEPETFQVIFLGDTQPRNLTEVDYFKHDIVEELIGTTEARFGVTLGDIVFDNLDVMEPHNAAVALVGLPWWNVIGNHDINTDAPTAAEFDDTFNRIYGPSYFSFDFGPVHFIALNNVNWVPPDERQPGAATWRPSIEERQLKWLEADLAHVPARQLIVLMMHIPLNNMQNAQSVYRLIENRPYSFSISGHTHWHEHRFLKRSDGWMGPVPHHHVVNVTACGSWWAGQPDELGIPHTTMRDGAPNGYSVLTFEDRGVTVDFKAARRPSNYQLNIMAAETVDSHSTEETPVYVNVFNGAEHSIVQMRLNNQGPWITLAKVLEEDPSYVAAVAREPEKPAAPWRALPKPIKSPHLWKGSLPAHLPSGTHYITVQATDVNGKLHPAMRVITVN